MVVKSAAEYRRHAHECRAFALRALSPEEGEAILKIAAAWGDFAKTRERKITKEALGLWSADSRAIFHQPSQSAGEGSRRGHHTGLSLANNNARDSPGRLMTSLFFLCYRRDSNALGVVIIAAHELLEARMLVTINGLDRGADFFAGYKLNVDHASMVTADLIGRMLLPDEIDRFLAWIESEAARKKMPDNAAWPHVLMDDLLQGAQQLSSSSLSPMRRTRPD